MYTASPSATHPTTRPKATPSSSSNNQHLILGLLLAALGLGRSSELLGSVLALLACPRVLVLVRE